MKIKTTSRTKAVKLPEIGILPKQQPLMTELYLRAQTYLRKMQKRQPAEADVPTPPASPERLLHELQVHQVELELQNAELRQTRDELETSLENYTDLYDFAPAGYFNLDVAGIIQQVNLFGANLAGVERSRLLGQSFERLVSTGQRPVVNAFLKSVFAGETERSVDIEFLHRHSPLQSVRVRAQCSPTGRDCRVVVVDITELKQEENKVRVSEIRYRRLFETAHDGVLLLDPRTRKITDANPFMTRLLDYPREQLVGKELFEIGLLKDETASREMFEKLKRRHEVRYENLPLESKGGRHQEVEVVANLYQENGHAVIQCNIRDITERKAAADALRVSEERYRNLFSSMDEGYCIIEMIFDKRQKPVDYRFLEVNPAFEKLTGLHGALGKRIREFVPDLEKYWYEIYGKVALTGEPVRVANEAKGMHRWFDIYAFRIGGNDSRKIAILFNNITERKQSETALRQSEERYRTLFTSIDEGFCVIESIFDKHDKPIDYRFLEVNPTFTKQTGLRGAVGKRMRELVPEIEDHWIEIYGQVALTGEPIRFMNEAKAMGGRWFDTYACRVGGAASRKVAVVFNDITARKHAEQELAEKARLLDLSHDAIIVRDMAGHIRYWNHGAEELYGWSHKEALGKLSHRLLRTEFPIPLKQMTEELHRTDRWVGELVHVSRAGRRITVLARKTMDRDGQGNPASVLENLTDITKRKQAESALSASEERFRAAVGIVTSLIWTNNSEGLMAGEQPGWGNFTGQTQKQYQGHGWAKAVHPEDAQPTLIAWKRAVANKSLFEFEHRLRRRDGKWRLCSVHAMPLLGADGLVREWVGVHTDITARKQAEETQHRLEVLAASNKKLEAEIVRRQASEQSLQKSQQVQARLLIEAREHQAELRQLSQEVLRAQEEERKRISRELHDVIAQTLAGINLRLASLKKTAGRNTVGFERNLIRTQAMVSKSVDIVHQFARELRPAVLDDLGLIPALHTFLKDFAKRTGLHTHLTAFADVEKINLAQRTVFFRVAQEALTNVSRHAQASRVDITLQKLAQGICMKVQDNGIAFNVEKLLSAKSGKRLGLLGMRERVEMVGGTFGVASAPGSGTCIEVTLPVYPPPPKKTR